MATRKRKPAKRKSTRRTKSKRRRRGLGDLLSDRALSISVKMARAGKKPNAAKIEAAAAAALCREGHEQYCSGKVKAQRAAKAAWRAKRSVGDAADRCRRINQERVSYGLKPKKCPPAAAAAAPVTSAQVQASAARAEAKGCVDTKRSLCVDKKVAVTRSTLGHKHEKLRKGCHKVKNVPGAYHCDKSALARITKGAKFFNRLTGEGLPRTHGHAAKGYKIVTGAIAKAKDGGLRKGCVRRHGHFECTKTAAAFYARFAKKKKKKH